MNGALITEYEDLIVHCILVLGHLLQLLELESMEENQHVYINSLEKSKLELYCEYF